MTSPILIVGAGPAGATAARALAQAGVSVQLLDRQVFPRNKPCGGGISLRVLERFPYLVSQLARIATHQVARLYLEGPEGESVVIESDGPAALMVRRVEFDDLLVALAIEAGATLTSGVDIVRASADDHRVVLVSRDGRRFEASAIIAADGVHSVVARRLGLNPGWGADAVALDMMEETPRAQLRDLDPSTLWVAYGYGSSVASKNGSRNGQPSGPPEGYAYIFPKCDHVNIGVGYVLSYYRARVGPSPYELQRAFIDDLRARGVVAGDSVRQNFTPFLIPVGGPLDEPGRGRVLLAGDAGGFVNAFTAEGIYYAMVSGELAARAVIDACGDVDSLAPRYHRLWRREIGAELRDSVLIQRYLFRNRRRIAAVIDGARAHPSTARTILDYAVGRRSYRSARRRLLLRSPRLAAAMFTELGRALVAKTIQGMTDDK